MKKVKANMLDNKTENKLGEILERYNLSKNYQLLYDLRELISDRIDEENEEEEDERD